MADLNLNIYPYRVRMKGSTVSGVVPTVPGTGATDIYYPDSTWDADTDLMVGETFTNTADATVWFRSDSGVHQLGYSGQTGNFLTLSDTPSTYTGYAQQWLRVNTGATGLEFFSYSGQNFYIETALDFLDTPTSADTSKAITYDYTNSGYTLTAINDTFIALSDNNETGYTNIHDLWRTNSAQTGIESIVGTDYYVDLTTVQTIASAKTFTDEATFNGGVGIKYPLVFTGGTTTVTINDILTDSGFTTSNDNVLYTGKATKEYIALQNFTTGGTANFVTLDSAQSITSIKTFTTNQNFDSGLTATNVNVTDDLNVSGNCSLDLTTYQYWGNITTNGSFRTFININGALTTEKRVSGSWVFCSSTDA